MRVLIVGLGDLGRRYATALASQGLVDELVLAGGGKGQGPAIATLLESSYGVLVRYVVLDAIRQDQVETLLRREKPDLVLQCGSLFSPWEILSSDEPHIRAIRSAGVGIQLAAQLPILISVMSAVRTVDLRAPVINLSWPDGTHPIVARLGLAPRLGLGNATMIWARVRSALMRHMFESGARLAELPLVRILGNASTLWAVLSCVPPARAEKGCRVYLGEDGRRSDEWAYKGKPLESGVHLNELTCASSMPVIAALLPGGPPARTSCPGVEGLPGGYPIHIKDGRIEFDLPPQLALQDAIDFNTSLSQDDGIACIEPDGTVIYTERSRCIMATIDPVLAEPLVPACAIERFPRLLAAIAARRDG